LRLRRPDTNRLRFVPSALVADVDVVVAINQAYAGLVANPDVLGAGTFLESLGAHGRVVVPIGIRQERLVTGGGSEGGGDVLEEGAGACGGVVVTGGVAGEGRDAARGVGVAGGVCVKREGAGGHVGSAGGVPEERLRPASGVEEAGGVAG